MVSFPYYSHTIPISLGIDSCGNSMGSLPHYWGSLKIPLKLNQFNTTQSVDPNLTPSGTSFPHSPKKNDTPRNFGRMEPENDDFPKGIVFYKNLFCSFRMKCQGSTKKHPFCHLWTRCSFCKNEHPGWNSEGSNNSSNRAEMCVSNKKLWFKLT